MFFICQYPPLAIKALWFNTLMADTAYNITHQPTIRHSLPHRASLRKTITQTCLTIYAACSNKAIYRCATAALPLPNSKVTVAQQQRCRCPAVNKIIGHRL